MSERLLAFYGDDFTGSTDALESISLAGARTVLFLEPPTAAQLERYPDIQAIGVAGLTRSLGPGAMEKKLRPAFAALRELGVRHVHYKVCSTFDSSPMVGSIGQAIELGAEIFGGRFVPVLVGTPVLGRYCIFGNLFARYGIGSEGEIYRLDRHPAMSRHPVTPANESDLRRHLALQTQNKIALIDVLQLARPVPDICAAVDAEVAAGARIILFDALYPEHVVTLGTVFSRCAETSTPSFSVGSSSVDTALAAHWNADGTLQRRAEWPAIERAEPMLVISGSCSPVTAGQIEYALAHGFLGVRFDPASSDGAALFEVVAALRSGCSTLVYTNRGESTASPLPASRVGAALGTLAREAVAQTGIRRLVIAGGDTSSYAGRALGLEAVEMIAPLAPGAPLCRAHAPGSPADLLEINFKGGQVGAEDYFVRARHPHPL